MSDQLEFVIHSSIDRLPLTKVKAVSGRPLIVKRYTRKRLELEHEQQLAELKALKRKLQLQFIRWHRRRNAQLYVLRLVCGMLMSTNPEMQMAGHDAAAQIGLDRSRRFAERHEPSVIRDGAIRLWDDTMSPNGHWSKVKCN